MLSQVLNCALFTSKYVRISVSFGFQWDYKVVGIPRSKEHRKECLALL